MSLTDYSSIENDISTAEEPKTLKRGEEVKARIIAVNSGTSDKGEYAGAQWFRITFDCPDDPMVVEFSDFLWDLATRDKLPVKQAARALHKFKTFADAIGLDYSRPFSMEDDLVGKTCWVILGVRKTDEYGDQNIVSKYVAGHGRPNVVTGNINDEDIPF